MQEPPRPLDRDIDRDRALSPPLNVIGDIHPHHHTPLKLAGAKKRKKLDDGAPAPVGGPGDSAEPRRLRRLHEACARCRRKKIKCDSMLPNCGACQGAGVECTQEDRHRQTLKPRGYTDQLEAQVDKCAALLVKFIPTFKLDFLDHYLHRYGIPFPGPGGPPDFPPPTYAQRAPGVPPPLGPPDEIQHAQQYPTAEYSEHPPLASGSARPSLDSASPPTKDKKPPKKDAVDPMLTDDKGRDPHGNDMSGFAGLIRGFGVGKVYAKGVKPGGCARLDFGSQIELIISRFCCCSLIPIRSQSRLFGRMSSVALACRVRTRSPSRTTPTIGPV